MAEYITREAAIAKLTALEVIDRLATMTNAKRVLADMPAADVAPVVHGRWIYEEETLATSRGYRCSACRRPRWLSPDVPEAFKYCPKCGAKMDATEEQSV